ncbi:MAG: alanine--tRNA ligase [Armatimonadota bacterium]
MIKQDSLTLKDAYINFFLAKGHVKMESASVVPENDPTCLFNTAGMQPLVPYLMGAKHPLGRRLVNFQKCFRLTDLESVGDKTHHTFFEMLGNWSLGDYFKKESITWSYEFLTQYLQIPVERLAVTVFEGNEFVGADSESAAIWESLGIPKARISFLPAEDNWWPSIDQVGPCGPDTEIFYWSDNSMPAPVKHDPKDERWVEIWNNVFMQYNRTPNGEFQELAQKNVDTGMGVERTTAVLSGVSDNYLTDIWQPIIKKIEAVSRLSYEDVKNKKPMRIIADHARAIVMIASDDTGITPSNTDQGYILRRLIRRMLRYAMLLGMNIEADFDLQIASVIIELSSNYYPEVKRNADRVMDVLASEKKKFGKTLEKGLKEFEHSISGLAKGSKVSGDIAFRLYDTFGFPIEMTQELAEEKHLLVDMEGFKECFVQHQEKSRKGSESKFKGGLSTSNEDTVRLHTATHLLHSALRNVLGDSIAQKGSNITPERLRFDFSFDRKVTDPEIAQVEAIVNRAIEADIVVECAEMTVDEALSDGAIGLFKSRYGETVTVYTIAEYSKEICGGPHTARTSELGSFKILKEESSSSGIRRIKAVVAVEQ